VIIHGRAAGMNQAELYSVLKRHNLSALYWHYLNKDSCGIEDSLRQKYRLDMISAAYNSVQQQEKFNSISQLFSANGIEFLPLKGLVVKGFYDIPELRFSCDLDILIHHRDFVKARKVLTQNGWTTDGVRNFHDMHFYHGEIHLELHYNICESMPKMDRVLADVWQNTRVKSGYELEMNSEFLLFHQVAHAYYHFMHGGCGIKSALDIRVIGKKLAYDRERFNALLERAGLSEFYKSIVSLTECWFDGKQPDDTDLFMEKYIIDGGAYGSAANQAMFNTRENRIKHIKEKLLLPRNVMYAYYPELDACHALLLYYHVRRYVLAFFHRAFGSK